MFQRDGQLPLVALNGAGVCSWLYK